MCGRMLVAEISACLRNCLSSCITVSARVFVGLLQLNFKLDEADRSTKGRVPCSCSNVRGEGVWEVLALTGHGFLLLSDTSLFLSDSSLSVQGWNLFSV